MDFNSAEEIYEVFIEKGNEPLGIMVAAYSFVETVTRSMPTTY